MSWSYSGDPRSSDKDAIRVIIGDTQNASPLLQDEEILYFLAEEGSVLSGAVAAADAVAARFARLSDETTGDLSRKCSQKYKHYRDLADQLRKDANDPLSTNPISYAGGVSRSDIKDRKDDPDRYDSIFDIGETDNHRGLSHSDSEDLDEGRYYAGDN